MKKTLLSALLISLLSLQGCSVLSSLVEKPDSEKTVEEFYTDATEAFEEKQWDTAITNYEKLKSYFPYGEFAEQSYLELAYSYYKYDEPESAIRELGEFIRIYPKHPDLAYAYYLRALSADSITRSWLDKFVTDPAARDIQTAKRAMEYYTELLNQFPQSRYAPKAKQRLVILRNQIARHELKVAQFYFNKQAYLAAANRARNIIENYPQAASTLEALEMMEASYDKLGMKENMTDIRRVLDLNKGKIDTANSSNEAISDEQAEQVPTKSDNSMWSKIKGSFSSLID